MDKIFIPFRVIDGEYRRVDNQEIVTTEFLMSRFHEIEGDLGYYVENAPKPLETPDHGLDIIAELGITSACNEYRNEILKALRQILNDTSKH